MYHISQDARSKTSAKSISDALMRLIEKQSISDIRIIDLVK